MTPSTIKKKLPRGLYIRGKYWWIDYKDQSGQRHREMVGKVGVVTQREAQQIVEQRRTQVRLSNFNPDDVRAKNVPFAEIVVDRRTQAARLSNPENEYRQLDFWLKRFGNKLAKDILPSDIEAARTFLLAECTTETEKKFRIGRQIRRKVSTTNRYIASLKSVYSLALKNRKVRENPCLTVKLDKEHELQRVRFLSDDEEIRLFAQLPEKYKPLVLIAMHTGLRKTELLSLKWMDTELGQIRVVKSKSKKPRVIPMNAVVIEALRCIPRHIGNDFVFVGKKPGQRALDLPVMWEEYLRRASIQNFKWHDLRHTFASRLVMRGVSLYTVAKLLGHSNMQITERYAHLAPDYMRNTVDVLLKPIEQVKTANSAS